LANEIERRKHSRSKVTWPITVLTDDGIIEGETRDIAVNGVHICSEEPLRLNEAFHMSITPPDHQDVDVIGKVIWSGLYGIDEENTAFGMGVCFVKISDGDRHFLKDMVSAHPE